jgi:hypothetical protein
MVVITKKGMSCHKDMNQVMANAHFGSLKVRGTDGNMHDIPAACIKKTTGTLKKAWRSIFFKEMGYAIPA